MSRTFKSIHWVITLLSACLLSLVTESYAQTTPSWTQITGSSAPGYGGQGVGVSFNTVDKSLWYAAYGGGLYKSTDFGTSWAAANSGITDLRVNAFTYTTSSSSSTPYNFFVATLGGGVFVSTDSGSTFTAKNSGLKCTFIRALTYTSGNGRLFAGTDLCPSNGGIYYSDNNGTSWTQSTPQTQSAGSGFPTNLRVNSIYYFSVSSTSNYLLASTTGGLYKSTDSGVTWAATSTPGTTPTNPVLPGGSTAAPNVYSVSYSTTPNAYHLFATVAGQGVFTSTDGTTWTASTSGLPTTKIPNSGLSCNIATTSPFECYLSLDGQGIYRTQDFGATWTQYSTDGLARQIRTATVTTNSGSTSVSTSYVWKSTFAGVYTSTDSGSTFTIGSGLPQGYMDNVNFDSNGVAYAASANGVYQLKNGQWTFLPGLPQMNSSSIIVRGTDVYASTNSTGPYKLTTAADGTTKSWVAMTTGLPANLANQYTQIRSNSSVTGSFYLGLYGSGFYYWDGTSGSWVARNTGLSADALFVRTLQANGQEVLLSTEAGLYVSKDGGQTWTLSLKDSSGSAIRASHVAIDPSNISNVYASVYNTDSVDKATSTSGLWKSTDAGTTWTQVTGLAGFKIQDIRVLNTGTTSTPKYTLFASSWDAASSSTTSGGGVYISTDSGANWTKTNTGLTSFLVGSMIASNTGGQVYLSTIGAGLFVYNSGTTSTSGGSSSGGLTISLSSGWNLVGNSNNTTIAVNTTNFPAATFTSVWKWNSTSSTWAFYTPQNTDGGAAYAATNGYEALTSINPGDGFWVNVKGTTGTITVPSATPVNMSSFYALPSGWSLISTGDSPTPKAFNNSFSFTPPTTSSSVTAYITSLWAWNAPGQKWYFYAPSKDNTAGDLQSYISSNGYLDFTGSAATINQGVGIWVNMPSGSTENQFNN